jgi:hypothetical protein
MSELAEIDGQAASALVCDFMICARCGTVDREKSRLEVNSDCPACQKPAGFAQLYYPINVRILVNLMQQTYHSSSPADPVPGPQASEIGTIIFFCTLRESLLNHFLSSLLRARRKPAPEIEKIFKDNKSAGRKFGRLFTKVVENSWEDAVAEASRLADKDFQPLSDLMKNAVVIRNKFMHEGAGWMATREVAASCINNSFSLFELFVSLHNAYVRPHLRQSDI